MIALDRKVAPGEATKLRGRVYGQDMHRGAGLRAKSCGTPPDVIDQVF